MSLALANKIRERAQMLARARAFFAKRGILEVDCPILSRSASIDAYIDLIPATYNQKERVYLHSSPEYGMKKLLSDGVGDIYQLSHVFRDGEHGKLHNPEFMMAEWYRLGFSFEEMIAETADFTRLFVGDLALETITYRDAFKRFAQIDPFEDKVDDSHLNYLLPTHVEPKLGKSCLTALIHYPPSQAALAKTIHSRGFEVAERFEIYYKGIELCNGYHELTDAKEQRARFIKANQKRDSPLPIDEGLLLALEKGLPDCCGVAVGFDRLMMLKSSSLTLSEVLAYPWDQI